MDKYSEMSFIMDGDNSIKIMNEKLINLLLDFKRKYKLSIKPSKIYKNGFNFFDIELEYKEGKAIIQDAELKIEFDTDAYFIAHLSNGRTISPIDDEDSLSWAYEETLKLKK